MIPVTSLTSKIVLVLGFTVCDAGWEICRFGGKSLHHYIYCQYGCCGTSEQQRCCTNTVGVIVGAVFGGLVILATLIGVIICCLQPRPHRGTIVHPAPSGHNVSVAFVHHSLPVLQPTAPPPYTMASPPSYSEVVLLPPTAGRVQHNSFRSNFQTTTCQHLPVEDTANFSIH